METVHLHLYFSGEGRLYQHPSETISVSEQRHEQRIRHIQPIPSREDVPRSIFGTAEDDSAALQLRSTSTPHSTSRLAGSSHHVYLKQAPLGPAKQISVDEAVLSAIFDAGLRGNICTRPIRLAAGVKCLNDQDAWKLCDLAPATFRPNYDQRLKDQIGFIPGVSRVLEKYLDPRRMSFSQSSSDMLVELGQGSNGIGEGAIQRQLWFTVTNGLCNQGSARKLQPLRRSEAPRVPDPILDLSNVLALPWHIEADPEASKVLGFNPDQSSDDKALQDEDLFDFCHRFVEQAEIFRVKFPTVTTQGVDDGHNPSGVGLHDVEVKSGGHGLDDMCDCPFAATGVLGPPEDEKRRRSNSLSHMSDVSMLLAFEGPIVDGVKIKDPEVIGGSCWLTQNVIRMQPLRQQQAEKDRGHQENHAGERNSLYERPDLGWWSDTNDESEVPLEDLRDRYTKSRQTNSSLSLLSFNEEDWVGYCVDAQHEYIENDAFFGGSETPMSTNQNSSFAEVIGKDHLLWHMWQRRASVAPRGEEDVIDLNNMFATDPDMKLFSSKWDLDLSDVSSSSNEDPMLQETMHNLSPRAKATSPMSPNSERRSYFSPTRPSSSSGYVGRSNVDSKRKSSAVKRFTWGGRQGVSAQSAPDVSKLNRRTMEVKRRKTLEDYDMMDRDANNDDSGDMLF